MSSAPTALLTSKQRRVLRGLAHPLQAGVQVGKQGLTRGVVAQADEALAAHELIKVRIVAARPERQLIAERLAAALEAQQVTSIGSVTVLYRQHPDPERRKIELPD